MTGSVFLNQTAAEQFFFSGIRAFSQASVHINERL